ncbi:hypothetical protein P691DRAFT_790901 [Macrolepiota fuliginosa MF-IS2]|uniref:Uncharacterized protein n=1 Tax=Macrolepiota fuliginosa MF-IS2 TaxID=1400762 RepID=A0A9P6BXL3_9AGAR|nr:hypothetical protein P691DRAFT_790901 [Macrolepiota fuliginosa MF-IS2]
MPMPIHVGIIEIMMIVGLASQRYVAPIHTSIVEITIVVGLAQERYVSTTPTRIVMGPRLVPERYWCPICTGAGTTYQLRAFPALNANADPCRPKLLKMIQDHLAGGTLYIISDVPNSGTYYGLQPDWWY